uniref:Clathrin light chain n=6 Tax=Boreoeutheria TaxID=1437010 RepID=A0A8C0SKM9_CANLF
MAWFARPRGTDPQVRAGSGLSAGLSPTRTRGWACPAEKSEKPLEPRVTGVGGGGCTRSPRCLWGSGPRGESPGPRRCGLELSLVSRAATVSPRSSAPPLAPPLRTPRGQPGPPSTAGGLDCRGGPAPREFSRAGRGGARGAGRGAWGARRLLRAVGGVAPGAAACGCRCLIRRGPGRAGGGGGGAAAARPPARGPAARGGRESAESSASAAAAAAAERAERAMGKSASKQFNNEVLKAHNEYRQKHGVPPLKLCKKLNREAQQYSEALASTRILKHSPESSRGQCGENLAWASYDQTGKEVADRWYSEIKNYNFQQPGFTSGTDAVDGVMNGEYYQESNGPTDSYAAISQVDRLQSEPESIRKWREEQTERLEALDANSRKQEAEWKEKAIKELEEWYARQDEQLQKTKANNRAAEEAFVNDIDESSPGTEWERVARLCDFNPKSSKQAKDVSRMRSVLISLKQAPLVH